MKKIYEIVRTLGACRHGECLPGASERSIQGSDPVQRGIDHWLSTGKDAQYKFSVCTGSVLLGAAGFLIGKKATTHHKHMNRLKPFCAEALKQKVVADGDTITGGGVSSSID